MTIYLLNNCESVFNKYNRDNINCELTTFGKEQATKLSGHYDLILVSPLKRCIQTLYYSKITSARVLCLDIIREYKQNLCDFFEDENIIFECENDIIKRIEKCKIELKYYSKQYNNILVITHKKIIQYLTKLNIDHGKIIKYVLE